MVIEMIIKHYGDFGRRMNEMIGKELSKSAWELLRTDGTNQAFSFTEQDKSEYEAMCYKRKDYRRAARKILRILECNDMKQGIVSIGCGKGILEWNLKNLKPELYVACTDYTEGNLKYLKRLFPQCDAFHRMDMRNAKHYSKIAEKNRIVLFYRISTELDYRAWKDVFSKMYQEGIQYVIWVPTELCTPEMALDYYKKVIKNFIKKKDKSRSVFCGYIYSKRTHEKMWRSYFRVKDAMELEDTMIFLLERHEQKKM